MTLQPDKPKRVAAKSRSGWRPRFSVRTLVILVTLVCAYLGCWGATMRQGVDDVALHIATEIVEKHGSSEDDPLDVAQRAKNDFHVTAGVPFVVGADRFFGMLQIERRYYFWFFGYVAKLPYERELRHHNGVPSWRNAIPTSSRVTPPRIMMTEEGEKLTVVVIEATSLVPPSSSPPPTEVGELRTD